MRALFVALSALALASPALAEGARQVLDCTVIADCDAAADCNRSGVSIRFTFEPVSTGSDGEGDYMISYQDQSFTMKNETGIGPYDWRDADGALQVLALTGDRSLSWTSLRTMPSPQGRVRFLQCEVTQ